MKDRTKSGLLLLAWILEVVGLITAVVGVATNNEIVAIVGLLLILFPFLMAILLGGILITLDFILETRKELKELKKDKK